MIAPTRKDPLLGKKGPAFVLPDQGGNPVRLASYRGRILVLYFYPKDFTSGCTLEARDFGAQYRALRAAGAEVAGVSRDGVARHRAFATRYRLPFRLLADEDAATCRAWKAYGKKSLYGSDYMGIIRSTFILDGNGMIRQVYRNVKVRGHAAAVLAAVRELRTRA